MRSPRPSPTGLPQHRLRRRRRRRGPRRRQRARADDVALLVVGGPDPRLLHAPASPPARVRSPQGRRDHREHRERPARVARRRPSADRASGPPPSTPAWTTRSCIVKMRPRLADRGEVAEGPRRDAGTPIAEPAEHFPVTDAKGPLADGEEDAREPVGEPAASHERLGFSSAQLRRRACSCFSSITPCRPSSVFLNCSRSTRARISISPRPPSSGRDRRRRLGTVGDRSPGRCPGP